MCRDHVHVLVADDQARSRGMIDGCQDLLIIEQVRFGGAAVFIGGHQAIRKTRHASPFHALLDSRGRKEGVGGDDHVVTPVKSGLDDLSGLRFAARVLARELR